MKLTTKILACATLLLLAATTKAQNWGQVQCAKPGDYVYLYSSTETMEVHGKLLCGQEVQILNRYDDFLFVRTGNGITGYVPLDSIARLKGKPSAKAASAAPATASVTAKKGTVAAPAAAKKAPAAPPSLTLADGTAVSLKLGRAVSSADAHAGDEVPFEVAEDVVVSGYTVVRKGTKATGTVAEASPKGRFGHNGKLTLKLTSVRLVDNQAVELRMDQESKGERHGVSKVLPVMKGKDVTLAQGTEMFAYVNGVMHLAAVKFPKAKETATSASAGARP